MTTFYMDTSAIAKRYIIEIGTTWVHSLTDPVLGHTFVVCHLTPIEFMSVLARRHREGKMTLNVVKSTEIRYRRHHIQEYVSVGLGVSVRKQARQLVQQHTLRTLDAIHLACALEARTILQTVPVFVSADKHLLMAAISEGLPVDNPLNHP